MMSKIAGGPETLSDTLRAVARSQRTVLYSEVAPIVGIDTGNEHFGALVGRFLDDINRVESAEGRPLLSAVVIGKESGMPGTGFFNCARELRRYSGRDDLAFWIDELQRVYAYWSRH
jgi:hypothetical protein